MKDAIDLISSHKEDRGIIFYSEGKNSWPFLKGPCSQIPESGVNLSYLTSDPEDPGIDELKGRFSIFLTDSSFIRSWIFENIGCCLMVMTTPDLNQFQLKRSKHGVHYVYIQHSLSSLHMIYRKGAFDHFDTIFCAGPHHVKEVRALEKTYNKTRKSVFEHGYPIIDEFLKIKSENAENETILSRTNASILIAPSWGPSGLIETGLAADIITRLLSQRFKVVLRPHPETRKQSGLMVEKIFKAHERDRNFFLETDCIDRSSFVEADIMISDWSGAALEYVIGLQKQVIWINTAKKVNNVEYLKIPIEPFEVSFRNAHGYQLEASQIHMISKVITENLAISLKKIETEDMIYNVGYSDVKAGKELYKIYKEQMNAN